MTVHLVNIRPGGPFFLGLASHARKTGALVHSDTLHAALAHTAARLGLALLDAAPQLRVTSVFPNWRGLAFYPRPHLRTPFGAGEGDRPESRKRWKSVRLVSAGLLEAWLAGDAGAFARARVAGSTALLDSEAAGGFPPGGLAGVVQNAAVAVDRNGGDATPFQRRGIAVNTPAGAGAWFMADIPGGMEGDFQKAVECLGGNGLGGERGVGYGHFRVESVKPAEDALLKPASGHDAFMSLSLYLPAEAEVHAGVLGGFAAYDCAPRGGWMHDPVHGDRPRRTVRMCVEGSVFPAVAGFRPGEVRDLRPAGHTAHPVWRSGLAFALPFKHPDPGRTRP